MRVELHPDARAELRGAVLWYDEQRERLGAERWTGLGDRTPAIRRHTLHRFPYVVAFEQHQERLLVLAIAHAKRRPLYWLTAHHSFAVSSN